MKFLNSKISMKDFNSPNYGVERKYNLHDGLKKKILFGLRHSVIHIIFSLTKYSKK